MGWVLAEAGLPAVHWSGVGKPGETDPVIFARARNEGWVVFTQDMDFSKILFETASSGPSTVLLRIGDELAEAHRQRVVKLILRCQPELEAGALLVIGDRKARLRKLPLTR